MILRIIILAYASIAILFCYAGTIDPNKKDSEYIQYANKYPFVLPIVIEKDNSLSQGTCVALGSDYFITAAHVVEKSKNQYVIFNNKKHKVLHIVIPSEFKSKNIFHYDIAIGRLEKPIRCKIYPKIYYGEIKPRKKVSIVGYGKRGNFDTGSIDIDGNKRAGTNIIDKINHNTIWCSSGRIGMTELEILITEGDSGGGVFIEENLLIGINSGVYALDGNTDSGYNDYSVHTKISVYKEWITKAIKYLETK